MKHIIACTYEVNILATLIIFTLLCILKIVMKSDSSVKSDFVLKIVFIDFKFHVPLPFSKCKYSTPCLSLFTWVRWFDSDQRNIRGLYCIQLLLINSDQRDVRNNVDIDHLFILLIRFILLDHRENQIFNDLFIDVDCLFYFLDFWSSFQIKVLR